MKDQLVSFETAKLAKEKGFKEFVTDYFLEDKTLLSSFEGSESYVESYHVDLESLRENYNDNWKRTKDGGRCVGCRSGEYKESYSAPTQNSLRRWLREKHKIKGVVEPNFECYLIKRLCIWNEHSGENEDVDLEGLEFKDFETFEEAWETLLEKSLKTILCQ